MRLKFVLVGDPGVGKRSLLLTYTTGKFPEAVGGRTSTVLDSYTVSASFKKVPLTVDLFNSPGFDDFAEMRKAVYPRTDVFILCYSCVNRTTFDNLNGWKDEVLAHCDADPMFILVGTQTDEIERHRVEKESGSEISEEEAEAKQKELGALFSLRCSSLEKTGISEIFSRCMALGLSKNDVKENKDCCLVL